MSFKVFFAFSNGLRKPITVPKGTKASIFAHVRSVEETLGLKVQQPMHPKDMPHWDSFDPDFRAGFPDVDDKVLCETVERHNEWVRRFYDDLAKWAEKPTEDGETLTPEDARKFWPGTEQLKVPPERWTADYYRSRMHALYEAMRGREAEGMTFDEKALTPRQAAAVVRIFDQYLDPQDLRLDVPKGRDYLASSYDGGYEWCEKCGAVAPEDAPCGKRKCPLYREDEE